MADILIADDHKFIRDMVRITLSTQGWSIDESDTATGTLEQVRSAPPKVLLLDVMFEGDGLTGFDVCREIKAAESTKRLPVIMLTALDSNEERRKGMLAGASHYLTKPFSPIDLINTLRDLIGDPPAVQTLGQYLIDEGVISHNQLTEALEMQRTLELRGHPRRLGEVLALMQAVSPEQLQAALERQRSKARI
jgi:DNA-binding response OmpR family regulator